MTLDLKQFQGIFFEESFEGLDAWNQLWWPPPAPSWTRM